MSGVVAVLSLAVNSAAQRPQWPSWNPGPSQGWNNNSAQVYDLTGTGWTLTSENGSISVPASIPSQQYIDLYNAGIIPDPLFGDNNTELVWVRDQNWTYSRTVAELSGINNGDGISTMLVFQGLDTFTSITFCGTQVAFTENQFRQYIVDISEALRSCDGDPQLSLNFGPAISMTHKVSEGPYSYGKLSS